MITLKVQLFFLNSYLNQILQAQAIMMVMMIILEMVYMIIERKEVNDGRNNWIFW